jgi:hypothetical protein
MYCGSSSANKVMQIADNRAGSGDVPKSRVMRRGRVSMLMIVRRRVEHRNQVECDLMRETARACFLLVAR